MSLKLDGNNPPAPAARALLPEVYQDLGNLGLAGEALAELGTAQRRDGKHEEAAASFGRSADAYRAAEMPEPEATSLLTQGEIYLELGDQGNATLSFERSVEVDPQGLSAPQAYYFLGGANSVSGDHDSAASFFTQGARIHQQLGNLEQASAFLTQALQLDLSQAVERDAHRLLAEILLEQGWVESAASHLFQAGVLSSQIGHLDDAAALLTDSIALGLADENKARAHEILAEIYESLGQLDAAEEQRQLSPGAYLTLVGDAIRSGDPDSAAIFYTKGARAHLLLGNSEQASAFLTQSLHLDLVPNFEREAHRL